MCAFLKTTNGLTLDALMYIIYTFDLSEWNTDIDAWHPRSTLMSGGKALETSLHRRNIFCSDHRFPQVAGRRGTHFFVFKAMTCHDSNSTPAVHVVQNYSSRYSAACKTCHTTHNLCQGIVSVACAEHSQHANLKTPRSWSQ